MAETQRADRVLLGCAFLLTGIGLVLVFSSSGPLSFGSGGQLGSALFRKSVVYAAVGIAGSLLATRVPVDRLRWAAYPALFAAVVLLLLPWFPGVGQAVNGAHRWVRFGPFGFQPSELAKLVLVLFLAHNLAKRGDKVQSFAYGYLPSVLIPAVPIGLVLVEPDLGTAALMGGVVAAMAYVGGVRLRHLATGILPVLPVLVYLLWFVEFRRDRLLAFLDPWQYREGAGFQLVQSLLAFGTGGLWGVGLGAGRQKLHYLPEAHTDFILSVWAEERGLVGVLFVLFLAGLLVWRGFRIALDQEDPYRRLIAVGVTAWLGLQAGLNALVVTGCVPTKGLPFPFLSYGGTGLVIDLVAVGLLAGMARKAAS